MAESKDTVEAVASLPSEKTSEEHKIFVRSWSKSEVKASEVFAKMAHDTSRYGVYSIQGKRKTMEDAHTCRPNGDKPKTCADLIGSDVKVVDQNDDLNDSAGNLEDTSGNASSGSGLKQMLTSPRQSITARERAKCDGFYGVYDGHGGDKCSEFVAKHLDDVFFSFRDWDKDVEATLRKAYKQVEEDWTGFAKEKHLDGGTTAIVAVFINNCCVVANVGDSAAVMCRKNGKALACSKPHNMKVNPDEEQRVTAAGGRIYNKRVGHPALNPRLFSIAVTRAVGDIMYKDPEYTSGKESGLIATPEVETFELSDGDQFLILACDGLWDVMTAEDACELVYDKLQDNETVDWTEMAKLLAEHAYERGSTDNITVLVVGLLPEQEG